jgi:hypothetical protein
MLLFLERHSQSSYATFGALSVLTKHDTRESVCVTLERPWVDVDHNGKRDANVSRVQPGRYRVIVRTSPARGYVVPWLCGVLDVELAYFTDEPTATTCQMHIANFPWDLKGCIGVGHARAAVEYHGPAVPDGVHARAPGHSYDGIVKSTRAFSALIALLRTAGKEEVWLEIADLFAASASAKG